MIQRITALPIRFGAWACVVLLSMALCELPAAAGDPTTTEDVIAMLTEEISEGLIMAKISLDGCDCAVSPQLVAQLQEAGASAELVSDIIRIGAEARSANPVTTSGIVEFIALGVPDPVVWEHLRAVGCECDTSAQSIIDLKRAGASDELIGALIELSAENPATAEP